MLKNILMSGLLCTFLSAESFDVFLQKAIKNSPYLESSAIAVQQTKVQGDILNRYENPNIELEYISFNPELGSSDDGYRVSYSQPVRLFNVENDNKELSNANIKNANAIFSQKKAIFIRDISLAYSIYSRDKMLLRLAEEEFQIAKKIYDISLARFESGTISRGVKLQALVDFQMSNNAKDLLSLNSIESYFSLLNYAGINEEIVIEDNYDFAINENMETLENAKIKLLKSQKNQALSRVKLNENSIEFIDVFAELENEPQEDIFRIGVTIPLAIFNDKSEEKMIANLEVSRVELMMHNENNRLKMDFLKLQKQRKSLRKLTENSEKILKTQAQLLRMYEEGYKISNINLLQLQDIKNKLIQTKRTLIQINTQSNQNKIYTNYLQGKFNE